MGSLPYNVGPSSDVNVGLKTLRNVVICHVRIINLSYWSYVRQLSYVVGPIQAANRRSIAALSVLLSWFVFWDTGVACWWYRSRMDNFWACSDPTIGLSLQPCWWFILITYGGRSPVITRDITYWNEGEPICQPTNCVILSMNDPS